MKIALILMSFCFIRINAQNQVEVEQKDTSNIRTVFISLGSGYPEFLNIKLGYQIRPDLSVCFKVSDYYNGEGGWMYFGTGLWGMKITKYFEPFISVINNISLDVGYNKNGHYDNYAIDLSVGNESPENKWLYPYWAFCISSVKDFDNKTFITAGLKIGLNFNF